MITKDKPFAAATATRDALDGSSGGHMIVVVKGPSHQEVHFKVNRATKFKEVTIGVLVLSCMVECAFLSSACLKMNLIPLQRNFTLPACETAQHWPM